MARVPLTLVKSYLAEAAPDRLIMNQACYPIAQKVDEVLRRVALRAATEAVTEDQLRALHSLKRRHSRIEERHSKEAVKGVCE